MAVGKSLSSVDLAFLIYKMRAVVLVSPSNHASEGLMRYGGSSSYSSAWHTRTPGKPGWLGPGARLLLRRLFT